MMIKDISPEKIGKLLLPGISKLLEAEIENCIKKEYDKLVKEAAIKVAKRVSSAVELFRMIGPDMQLVVNLFINKEKINLED